MSENEIAKIIVDIAFKIHLQLGPGLLESVYEEVMCYELQKRNIEYQRQKAIPVIYEEKRMEIGFRSDIIVMNKVVVEIKSIEALNPVHFKTLLTYLRLTEIKLGLLINFNEALIKDGIRRVVNNL